MKIQLLVSLIGLITAAVTANNSYAQSTAMLATGDRAQKAKLSHYSNHISPIPINEVSTKTIRAFVKYFHNVDNQQWFPVGRNKYLATFTNDEGKDSRALLASNGYLFYTISFSNEQSLPNELRKQIKSSYVDYTIGKVNEITTGVGKVWVINLEDKNNIVVIRITPDGILDELEHFQKSLPAKKQKQ